MCPWQRRGKAPESPPGPEGLGSDHLPPAWAAPQQPRPGLLARDTKEWPGLWHRRGFRVSIRLYRELDPNPTPGPWNTCDLNCLEAPCCTTQGLHTLHGSSWFLGLMVPTEVTPHPLRSNPVHQDHTPSTEVKLCPLRSHPICQGHALSAEVTPRRQGHTPSA